MNITRTEITQKIDQIKFIEKLLSSFNKENCKATPMEKGFQINEESEILTEVPYRQLIGGLMYLTTTSRPDIGRLWFSQKQSCVALS